MVEMVSPIKGDTILEPCGGKGDFIDALLDYNKTLSIETCELNKDTVKYLKEKYKNYNNIHIRHADTLTDTTFDKYSLTGHYDKIIGNPPYGAWQEYDHRELLKNKYRGFYVKETYSLFLLRCITLLKPEGILTFIIPDTFLFLHNHKELRSFLLTNTLIKEILIFPSKFFPGVSFGYSNLCIITVKKTNNHEDAMCNVFHVFSGFSSDKELELVHKNPEVLTQITLMQKDVFDTDYHAFMLNNEGIDQLINSDIPHLDDFANCVTGIYCGDNQRFMFVKNQEVKRSKGYQSVDIDLVDFHCSSLLGASKDKRYVPLVKGSSKTKYIRENIEWFIDWNADAINYYNSEKKARFQNSSYYFKKGIALPMVKSSRISATIMDNMVFDQSIVGVFPKSDQYFLYLLGLLNSDIFNKIVHVINPTANNSANYLKKVPIPIPKNDDLLVIDRLVDVMIKNPRDKDTENTLNEIYSKLYGNFKINN